MKLSIIIPAYNVEQYIGNCLESIFSQKITSSFLEVIVINDGSKDGTDAIINSYVKQHSNLIYIKQVNQGQSIARNEGLKRAEGDYIWFVDSDDATTENSIQTIFSYIEKYPNADFLTFDNIYLNCLNGEKHYSRSWGGHKVKGTPYEKAYGGREAKEIFKSVVPWYHVFKRGFLISNNLYFIPGLLHEDNELTLRLFFFAKEVRFIPFAHYIYSGMRPGSITTENLKFNIKTAKDIVKIIGLWKEFEREHVETKEQKRMVNNAINKNFRSLMLLATRKEEQELYALYKQHNKEWRKGYKETFKKSISLNSFSWVELIRFLVTLYCPKYIKYTEARTLKGLIKRHK